MSSVVISNRNIFNQRIGSIEKNKVLLPFNVSKDQTKKLVDLLSKIKVTFSEEPDKLNIESLVYNNLDIKTSDRQLSNCRFTLSKTYVVTMKQSFISKVKAFYDRIEAPKLPERPVFNIGNETNLQQALEEATAEIDISTINASLANAETIQNNIFVEPAPTPQVLANNPLGETVIENPVNLNNNVEQVPVTPVAEQTPEVAKVEPQPTPVQPQPETVNNIVQAQPVAPTQVAPEVATPTMQETPVEEPKVKVKKLKGNVLAVPIVLIWLGAVFYGTLKLVTSILT